MHPSNMKKERDFNQNRHTERSLLLHFLPYPIRRRPDGFSVTHTKIKVERSDRPGYRRSDQVLGGSLILQCLVSKSVTPYLYIMLFLYYKTVKFTEVKTLTKLSY